MTPTRSRGELGVDLTKPWSEEHRHLLLAVGRFVNFMRRLVGKYAASFGFGYLVPPSKGAIFI